MPRPPAIPPECPGGSQNRGWRAGDGPQRSSSSWWFMCRLPSRELILFSLPGVLPSLIPRDLLCQQLLLFWILICQKGEQKMQRVTYTEEGIYCHHQTIKNNEKGHKNIHKANISASGSNRAPLVTLVHKLQQHDAVIHHLKLWTTICRWTICE